MTTVEKDFCSTVWFEVWYRLDDTIPKSTQEILYRDYMLVGSPVSELEVDNLYQVIDLAAGGGIGRKPQALDIILAFHKLTKKTSAQLILDSFKEYPFFNAHTQLLGDPEEKPHVLMPLPGYTTYQSKYWVC